MPDWKTIYKFISNFGWTKGVFTLFFFMAHSWIYALYQGRLKDRQAEINRIAEDNREYREKFLELLDQHFGLKGPKNKKK